MPLADGQVQVRSLVLGPGTSYPLAEAFNPFGREVRADHTGARPWRSGSWSGLEVDAEAVIPIRVVVNPAGSPAAYVSLHQALAAAFAPSDSDLDLTFAIGGVEYLLRGRPRVVDPQPRKLTGGRCWYRLAFVALEPLIYSAALHTANLVLPVTSGGLTFPLQLPFAINATVTAGTAVVVNAGTATANLLARVNGPVSQPRLSVLAGALAQTWR